MRRWNAGKAPDDDPLIPGLFCRSAWERNYARWLEWGRRLGTIRAWWYEPMRFEFPLNNAKRFTPDFLVLQDDEPRDYFVEVKGWWKPGDKAKLGRMARYYPEVEVHVVDKVGYRTLASVCRGLIPSWEVDERPGPAPDGAHPSVGPTGRDRVPPHVARALRARGISEEDYLASLKRFGRRRRR